MRPRQPDDLRFAIRYLCDYPEPHGGTLTGLIERVIRWHRHVRERERMEREIARLGGCGRPAVSPPIPLPAAPGVTVLSTVLSTVGAIVEEGARMRHCIATRAEDALQGRCYLFHIDYAGQRASVEVSAQGMIVQAQGPHNTDNAAVRWRTTRLERWAAGLRARETVPSAQPVRRARRGRRPNPDQLTLPF